MELDAISGMTAARERGNNHMHSVRVLIGFTVFLFLSFFSQAAYSGTADLLLARLQLYDPGLHLESIERPAAVADKQFIRALSSVATNPNEDWHIRISAIRVLGDTQNPAATDALMTTLLDFCPAIRWNSANALGGFSDDPRVVDALLGALRYETLYIREAAIRSLGKIGSRKAVPRLVDLLTSRSFAIKSSAITALGQIGDTDAIPYLKRIAEQDADPLLNSEARSALARIDGKKKGL
jgi:HEAT repeat protein